MKLLIMADIHGSTARIKPLAEAAAGCDAVVIAGDITNFGGAQQLRPVLDALKAFEKPVIAVGGNCDLPEVDRELERNKCSVHANVIFAGELAFMGVGGSLPCPGHTPNEADESVFRDILEETVKLTEGKGIVLVTHQPAWGTKLDMARDRHTGSRAIRDFIKDHKPLLAVSGHIHEAIGTDSIGHSVLINPGPLRNGRFAVVEIVGNDVRDIQLRTQE